MTSSNKTKQRTSETGFCVFGANILLKYVTTLKNQIEGAKRGGDIEYVHQLRVTSRRIRALMSIFKPCFQKKIFKRWRTEIQNITRSLGAARDTDVQNLFLEEYLKKLQPEMAHEGVEYLLKKHREKRETIQPQVISTLEQLIHSHVLDEIINECDMILTQYLPVEPGSTRSVSVQQKASQHISRKLQSFLDMEEYVHTENAIQQHHQMRIAAKRLRYTMEIFSNLYEDNLKEFISLLKQIQDYLGEMHDCDVWIQYIPQFIEKIQNEHDNSLDIRVLEAGLNEFLRYIQNRRHLLYKDFISLWDKSQKQEIFDRLLEKTHIIILQFPDAQKKIAIIADEHGNIHALNAVIEDAKKHDAMLFLHAGDFVGYGAYPSDVIEQLKSENVLNIIGNYDRDVLRTISKGKGKRKNNDPKTISLNFTRKHLSKKDIMFLKSLPQKLQIKIGSCRILLAHGSPESPEEHLKPTTSDNRLRTLAHRISADIVIIGHSHQPFVKTVDNVTFINPGSVGRPDDANPQASYALMTLNPFSVELLRVPYDVNAAVQAIRKYRLPELFAQMLLHGISLEAIEDLDKKRGVLSVKNNKMRLKQVQQLAEKFSDDLTHPIQVRRLALILFDELKELFSFDENDKLLLECAALLHDIGWSQGWKGHHKTSLRLILNDTKIPFTIKEKYIIGSIARYHRKTVPQQKHYHFSALKLDDQRIVRILSAIMKIADGLDASHHSIVKNINIKINTSTITMQCIVTATFDLEQRAVDKKKTLFEQISKRRLIIQWQKN